MKLSFMTFMTLFCLIYGAANYYIGMRTWNALAFLLPVSATVYWCLLIFAAATYLISSFWNTYFPTRPLRCLSWIGSYWLAVTYYAFLFWLLIDVLTLINAVAALWPFQLNEQPWVALTLWSLIAVLMGYGRWVATHPVITRYTIKIDKQAGDLSGLHAVLVADVHLGPLVGAKELTQMVTTVNQLQPDIVLLAGDMIDENVPYFVAENMSAPLQKIKARFGVYAVLGNHEYIGGYAEQSVKALEQSGITVLRDSYLKIADSFFLIGRDDRSCTRFTGKQRASLASVIEGIDPTQPLLLMDHQPADLSEAQRLGIDLQLSGHTHRGQIFPNNFITQKVFEIDWGYLAKQSLQVIVSSGYATWGPPIRLGNRPELVSIQIEFTGNACNVKQGQSEE